MVEEIDEVKLKNLKELIKDYVSGKISISDLEKANIDPTLVLKLDESLILKLFEKGLPKNLFFSDDLILYAYGRTLSGNAIFKLSNLGYLSKDKVVLISNKHSLPITDPSLAAKPEEILNFYSATNLLDMTKSDSITPEFVRNYNTNLIEPMEDEAKEEHFKNLLSNLESNLQNEDTVFPNNEDFDESIEAPKPESNLTKLLLYYYEVGILPARYTDGHIDFKSIKKHYENHKLSYSNLVELYVNNIITSKQFLELLETAHITAESFYSTPIVSEEVLKSISSEKRTAMFSESIKSDSISLENLMHLYLSENILTVDDLKNIFVENQITESITPYLDENVKPQKLEELYTHYLLDYNSLVTLKKNQIISESQFDDIKDKINAEEFYKDLSSVTDLYIHTTPDNISASIHHSIDGRNSRKLELKKEQELLHQVFGSPSARESLPLIHATDLQGHATSLDGYSCVPMPKFNVVTLKKFETDCDTYVMPYQQAAFFLHNSYEPNNATSNSGFQAEILLPFEDFNDPSAIAVISSSTLDYRRNLLEAILELSNQESEKEKLFKDGKPIEILASYLKNEINIQRKDMEHEL